MRAFGLALPPGLCKRGFLLRAQVTATVETTGEDPEGTVTFTFTDSSGKVVKTQDADLGSRRRARSLLQRRRTRTATITVQAGLLGRVTVTASFTPRNNRGRPARAPPIIIVINNPPTPGAPVIIKCAPVLGINAAEMDIYCCDQHSPWPCAGGHCVCSYRHSVYLGAF